MLKYNTELLMTIAAGKTGKEATHGKPPNMAHGAKTPSLSKKRIYKK